MLLVAAGRYSKVGLLGASLAVVVLLVGCAGKQTVPVGNAAEHIRKLALGYVQFAAANQGVGPADQETLKKHLIERSHLTPEQADSAFVSPRDNQPYQVFWAIRPMGSGPIGPDPPKPSIIIVEKTGADGTRYLADGRLSIRQLPPAEVDALLAGESSSQK